jgi:hypothetical protein
VCVSHCVSHSPSLSLSLSLTLSDGLLTQVHIHLAGLREWAANHTASQTTKRSKDLAAAMAHGQLQSQCKSCGLEHLLFEPPPLYCGTCGVRIKKNQVPAPPLYHQPMPHACARNGARAGDELGETLWHTRSDLPTVSPTVCLPPNVCPTVERRTAVG